MFACTVCGAATAETISDGAAAIEVVRHAPSCALLALRTRERWPLAAPALPNHTGHTPWAHLAADRNTLRVWKQRRARIARR